ncbi:hypothetical protein ACQPZF_11970 [Actinosynnema sp. CS-041913]|uniref:hypothetical protein n=1 Tax=Actinosynnema sp. CS-041913 TaxID=3239917 RepID=UPI003D93D01F
MINRNPSHTAPLVTRVDVTYRELFKKRPVPSSNQATVYLDRHGNYQHLTHQLGLGDGAGLRAVFLVDTSVVNRTLTVRVPSAERAYSFLAQFTVSWRITDPVAAVETNLTDAEFIVKSHVTGKLREITVQHPIEEVAAAEQEAHQAFGLAGKRTLRQGVGLLDCGVALSLDESTAAEVRRRKEHARALEARLRATEATRQDLGLRAAEQEMQLGLEAQRARYELERQRQQQAHELAMKRADMEFYADAIKSDQLNLVGLKLAADPNQVNEVIALFMQRHKLDFESARGMLNSLLENGLVGRSNVADIMAKATAVIANRLSDTPFAIGLGENPASLPGGGPLGSVAGSRPAATPLNAADLLGAEDSDDFDDEDDV